MAKKTITWQALERMVRSVAESKFGAPARAEDISGVKCDCIIHLNDGSIVAIEISKENKIDKLRTDLSKFNTIRPHFFKENIFPKCYFITIEDPTPSLIEAGKSSHVQVFSIAQFLDLMLGITGYINLRRQAPFGSAIDLYSGEPDQAKYVQVNYFSDAGESFSAERIAEELVRGKTVVLIGDYGSGKSRCAKEVFEVLAQAHDKHFRNPVAINLRENWGLKRASEIITRHFTDLGLGNQVADILKAAYSQATIYLLDGFDEMGAQTWSDDPAELLAIRRQSVVGIKDLISKAKGGVLVTGREHYFNNDAELLECLGLANKSILFLHCHQELTAQQFSELIGRESGNLPPWIPKKPLIGTIIRDIEPQIVDEIFETSTGQVDFWNLLLETLCEREAKINPILDATIIRALYAQIGRLSRSTSTSLGPISIKDINEAFERTTGRPPTDESATILQRLPGLSRIAAESLDRQFVDTYILDGLKAEDVLGIYGEAAADPLSLEWRHPLESFGAFFVATRLQSTRQAQGVASFVKRHREIANRVLLSDLLAGLFLCDSDQINFGDIEITGGRFFDLSLADSRVEHLRFRDCVFEALDVTDAEPASITISDSVIERIAGVTSTDHLPAWIVNCLIGHFQSIHTLAAIRDAGLSIAQTFLLSSLRKLFLQPGGGRKESSMYKGYGDSATKKICEKVISILLREKFCRKVPGSREWLYIPDRSFTGRVKAIMSQLTTSKDEVWLKVSLIQ